MKEPILKKDSIISHPLDIEYFTDHPAPIMELIHSQHFTNFNTTTAFFSPLLYFLIRALGCEQVLEIGIAQGATSLYMASAIKDNAVRYQMHGNMYYGIDIIDESHVRDKLNERDLPNIIIQADTINLTPEWFPDVKFDLIYQDGCHDKEHIVHEFKVLWPKLKDNGKGYFILHDTMGPGEIGWEGIKRILDSGEVESQYVTIDCVYGLTIIRNVKNFDFKKRHWVI